MDLDSKMENIKNGTLEVVTEEELKEKKLEKDTTLEVLHFSYVCALISQVYFL